jgi:hypothetical protein
MANVIAKKSFMFVNDDVFQNDKTGEQVSVVKETFTLPVSADPQAVPDWVPKTDLFKLAVKDKSLVLTQDEVPNDDAGDGKKGTSSAGLKGHQHTATPGWNK